MTDAEPQSRLATLPGHRAGVRALADLATPMAVRVGATLRVADHLAAGATTSGEVARACSADSDAVARLLTHWAWAGLVDDVDGELRLTALGEQLRSDHPGGRRAWLDVTGGVGRGDLAFVDLLHTVRTGEPAYPIRYGRSFWDDLAHDQDLGASFDALMSQHVQVDAQGLVECYPWGEVDRVADVGGGSGTTLRMLLEAHPHLHGTLVDLDGPATRAGKAFAAAGLGTRTEVRAGSFFDPLPRGADVYLLSAIVHDWDDRSAVALLRRCAEAARPGGRVLVVESCGVDGESVDPRMDLRMLVYTGGRERGIAALAALAAEAGLTLEAVHRSQSRPHIVGLDLRPGD